MKTHARGAGAGLPGLLIFDLDGTLQDTMAWWPEVAREGVARLGRSLGRPLPPPSRQTAFSVLGKAGPELWSALLPVAEQDRWPELRSFILPVEIETLRSGRDFLFPGTRELLSWLQEGGARIALASNCRRPYLEAVRDSQGLGPLLDFTFCLDSPGVEDKGDMLRLALEAAGTRDALMVGDREGDAAAARQNGLPFLLREGFHRRGDLPAEGATSTQEGIRGILERRMAFFADLGQRLEGRIGVTGPPGVGKSLFTRQLARALPGRRLLSLDAFRREPAPAGGGGDPLARAFELPAFRKALEAGADLVEGLFLEDPRLRPYFDRILHLRAPEEELLKRIRGRDGERAAETLRRSWLPAYERFPPHESEDRGRWFVDFRNPLEPRLP